ncbi:MAG: hypothetical protein WB992_16210 [Bryobacteraceae bacterium]
MRPGRFLAAVPGAVALEFDLGFVTVLPQALHLEFCQAIVNRIAALHCARERERSAAEIGQGVGKAT